MAEAVIAGIGQTAVGEHYDISLRDLAYQASEEAIKDAGGLRPEILFVGNMLSPVVSHQGHLGTLIADYIGLVGSEAATIEAGGASGGAALRMAFFAIASGEVDVALVVGAEKFTDQLGAEAEAALTIDMDSDYEAVQGITPSAQAALLMRRYMYEFNVAHECFAGFPVTAHANGTNNPHAMFRKAISVEAYKKSSSPDESLNLFDAAPFADGAAAVVLTRPELIPPGSPLPVVGIAGSSMVTDHLALHDRGDPLGFNAARLSVERACRQAGILPGDVDLFELYDSYSVIAALSLEAAGFARRGEGWKLAETNQIGLNGSIPVATCGGLKARGNPGGATGVYQAVEACLQLRGLAGKNQIAGAQRALIQCLGGTAATAVTHVLEVR